MTEEPDQRPVPRAPDPSPGSASDPHLPTHHDMFSGVLDELQRHARVMRLAVRRALRPDPSGDSGAKVGDLHDDNR